MPQEGLPYERVSGACVLCGLFSRFEEGEAATSSVLATEAAKQILATADAAMGFHHQCGLSRVAQTEAQYTPDGRLWQTNKYGVYEVSSNMILA